MQLNQFMFQNFQPVKGKFYSMGFNEQHLNKLQQIIWFLEQQPNMKFYHHIFRIIFSAEFRNILQERVYCVIPGSCMFYCLN